MKTLRLLALCIFASLAHAQTNTPPVQNPNLNPEALHYTLPADIPWVTRPGGADQAVLLGDPDKPGPYILLVRWHAGHTSRPHFHPHDRYITVLSGTWWVGTGSIYSPATMVPMPTGSFITHFAKQIHYDGAKDADCVIEIVGEGPATATPAEMK
jgi:hypothetical protein